MIAKVEVRNRLATYEWKIKQEIKTAKEEMNLIGDACVTMEAKAIWNQSKEYARLSSKIETLNEVLMDIIDIRCEKIFEDTN